MATSLFSATPTYPATFTQPLGENIADYLASELRRPTDIGGIMPQVAGIDPFTQAAQQKAASQAGLGAVQYDPQGRITGIGQGTGIAGYEPFLQGAAALAGPQGYQQYMSPYQQDVINATLAQYDVQAKKGLPALAAQAIGAGAYGGGREGIQRAEYQTQSDLNRALLEAQLRQQGYGQAQQLAAQQYNQQLGLAGQAQGLAAQQISGLSALGQQQQAQQQQQDPLVQMQQQELQLKAQDLQIKAQKTQADIAIEQQRLELEKEKIASHERLEGAKLGAQATQHKQKAESDKVVQGIKLGMEAEFKKKELSLKEKENTQPKE